MCNAFSCILTRNRDVLRHKNPNVHSHASMMLVHNIKENVTPERINWIRMECTPPNNKYSSPITQWVVKVDEATVPLWYSEDKDSYDTIVRNAAEQWKKNHCIDGCYCNVELHDSGAVSAERWFRDGKLHRTDGHAAIFYYKNGTVKSEYWFRDGQLHRLDGPAYIYYYESGSVMEEQWYRDGQQHRTDGPACIYYNQDGSVNHEYWYRDDLLHRTDGPTCIHYYKNGTVKSEYWFRDGKEIDPLTKR